MKVVVIKGGNFADSKEWMADKFVLRDNMKVSEDSNYKSCF